MTIKLYYKYIKHDIDQWTFRLGKVGIQDESIRNEAQSSSVSSDISFYRRKIVEALAQIRNMLRNRLTVKEATSTITDANGNEVTTESENTDQLNTDETAWEISLKDAYYNTDAQVMADLMHKYIVRSVITEWAVTYSPSSVASVSAELEPLKDQLLAEAYNRKKPVLSTTTTTTTTTESGS